MPELISPAMSLILAAVGGYLLGAIPFGIVMAKLFGLGDLRQVGSGNIGATNVLRTGNKLAAFLTVLLDAGKGGVAVLVARAMAGEDAAQLAGLAAFLGHLFPIYLGLRGGKGVATFLGILLALAFPMGLAACATWLVSAALSRMSSMGALGAALFGPVWAAGLGYPQGILAIAVMGILVYLKHIPNIQRILAGTEPKIGQGK